ncbi:hypothetical protein H0Z60_12890 [Ectothiorhodospiraceae bacterium WFHF3C12]|nr:hypothetical protein [Ectothiorhodospiraceae bacterium WFHF3C12]
MEQQMIVAGVKHFKGNSKSTGNAYEFHRLVVLVPASSRGPVASALGYEAAEWDAEASVFQACQGMTFPAEMVLQMTVGGDGKARVIAAQKAQTRQQGPAPAKTAAGA